MSLLRLAAKYLDEDDEMMTATGIVPVAGGVDTDSEN